MIGKLLRRFTRSRAVSILCIIVLLILVIFSGIICSLFFSATLTERHNLISETRQFPQAYPSCGGDAACCARRFSPLERPHIITNATFNMPSALGGRSISWRMAVHQNSDHISYWVRRAGVWDITKTHSVLNALHPHAKSDAVLLDIGANIGWFALAIANAGYNVVAVEPFAENLALVRHSLCLASDDVRKRVTLLPYALGSRDGIRCELWQIAAKNRGDTFTVCDGAATAPAAAAMREQSFIKLGVANVRRLDTLIRNEEMRLGANVVLKIDVEGFEPFAFAGAQQFLANFRPSIIFSEYCPKMIRSAAQSMGMSLQESDERPKAFLDFMEKAGYSHAIVGTGTDPFWGPIHEVEFKRK